MTNQSPPISTPGGPSTMSVEKASIGQRFFAYVIDSIILGLLNGFWGFMSALPMSIGINEQALGWWNVARGIIGAAIPAAYFIWPYSKNGQTLGKRALKIRVISIDGSPLNWRRGILRTLGYILSGMPLGLGFLWAIWDSNKQAGHDKIAGTCVVLASVPPEQLKGSIQPSEVRRTQRRWVLGLGIPTLLVLAGFLFTIQRGVTEVREMRPWPSPEYSPEELAAVDLSNLGLQLGQIRDAREEETWSGGSYKDGVLIIYVASGRDAVAIWALRYGDKQLAANDFTSVRAWAEGGNCGAYATAYWGTSGVIHCQFIDAYDKIFWNGYWIIDVVALEGFDFTAAVLVDQVRDAIAAHWRGIAESSP